MIVLRKLRNLRLHVTVRKQVVTFSRKKKASFFPVVEGFKIVRSRGSKKSNCYSNPFLIIFIFLQSVSNFTSVSYYFWKVITVLDRNFRAIFSENTHPDRINGYQSRYTEITPPVEHHFSRFESIPGTRENYCYFFKPGMAHFYYRKYFCMSCVNCENFKTDPFYWKNQVFARRESRFLEKRRFQEEKGERLKRLMIRTFVCDLKMTSITLLTPP